MKVKGNTAFVELFMSYPFDMLIYTLHSWNDPRFLISFVCVCVDFLLQGFLHKKLYKWPGTNNWTKHIRIWGFVSPHKNVRKKHRQTIGKAKRKTKYAGIVLKGLNAVTGTFEPLITHDWTRLKILRKESHYRSCDNSNTISKQLGHGGV